MCCTAAQAFLLLRSNHMGMGMGMGKAMDVTWSGGPGTHSRVPWYQRKVHHLCRCTYAWGSIEAAAIPPLILFFEVNPSTDSLVKQAIIIHPAPKANGQPAAMVLFKSSSLAFGSSDPFTDEDQP